MKPLLSYINTAQYKYLLLVVCPFLWLGSNYLVAFAALFHLYLKVELLSGYCNQRGFALFAICYVNLGSDLSVSWVRYATAKVADPAMGELHNYIVALSLGRAVMGKASFLEDIDLIPQKTYRPCGKRGQVGERHKRSESRD